MVLNTSVTKRGIYGRITQKVLDVVALVMLDPAPWPPLRPHSIMAWPPPVGMDAVTGKIVKFLLRQYLITPGQAAPLGTPMPPDVVAQPPISIFKISQLTAAKGVSFFLVEIPA
jgi:hypothetical protein